MPTGKNKWFNQQIGAGFIRSDEGDNVFFRQRTISESKGQILREGQCVRFEIANNRKSISQTAVKVITIDLRP